MKINVTKPKFEGINIKGNDLIDAGTSIATGLLNSIGGGRTNAGTAIGSGISTISNVLPQPYNSLGKGVGALTTFVSSNIGAKMDDENIAKAENGILAMNSVQANNNNFDDLQSQMNSLSSGINITDDYVGDAGWFGTGKGKIKKEADRLRGLQSKALAFQDRQMANNLSNIKQENVANHLVNYAAFGGNLTTHGSEFSNGLLYIGNGGSHEENPNQGVQMGVDPKGVPNLVEEGETIYNDYVFSKRLKVPEKLRNKYKLGGDISFADASKKLAKEHEERPNDPISTNGFNYFMDELSSAQEEIRGKKEIAKQKRQVKKLMSQLSPKELAMMQQQIPQEQMLQEPYLQEDITPTTYAAKGGKLANKYDGLTELTQKLKFTEDPNALDFSDKNNSLLGQPTIALRPKTKKDLGIVLPDLQGSNTVIDNEGLGRAIRGMQSIDQGKNPKDIWNNYQLSKNKNISFDKTAFRYIPPLTNLTGIIQNVSSKPDYSRANAIANKATQAAQYDRISAKPLGDYMKYTPMDRLTAINQLNAQAGASRRALVTNAGGNKGLIAASLLSSDYNTGNQLGNLFRQANEYNIAQRERVSNFNKATNQYNSQLALEAARANQVMRHQAQSLDYQGFLQSQQMKEAIDAQRAAALNANINAFSESLGNIGKESAAAKMAKTTHGYYTNPLTGDIYYNGKKLAANGGLLTKDKRRKR